MLELRVKEGRRYVPLFDLPARMGRAQSVKEIGDAVEGLIAFLDEMDGDPDLEDDDPAGQCDEDGINSAYHLVRYTVGASGPGCPISDNDHAPDGS